MTYFRDVNTKSALEYKKVFTADESRPDLLLEQYRYSRKRLLKNQKPAQINDLYMDWLDFLFAGFNVVVFGSQSKYALLETFKKKYLDSGKIPDFKTACQSDNCDSNQCDSPIETEVTTELRPKLRRGTRTKEVAKVVPEPSKRVKPPASSIPISGLNSSNCPMLNIITVRMHGLDPIKSELFNHSVLDIIESRRIKESDLKSFINKLKSEDLHYVFLIHSFEYFLKDCDSICETIFQLYSMDPNRIHLVISSDLLNAGKKLNNLKIKLRLAFFVAPFTESFLWEKTSLMNEFDDVQDGLNKSTVHRLFNDKTDLQSLKDIYQALDQATKSIMKFIFKDYIDKHSIEEALGEDQNQQPHDSDIDSGSTKRTARAQTKSQRSNKDGASKRRKKAPENYLDFHHLLNHCESNFIIRRGAALRDHLGELKDHSIISEDQSGNKIQCLVDARICSRFLQWVGAQDD